MKRRNLPLFTFFLMAMWVCYALPTYSAAPKPMLFQIKIYHLAHSGQEALLDKYLQHAYLPALHRAGISNVGVFKPAEKSDTATTQQVFVFIPIPSQQQFFNLEEVLARDKQYTTAAHEYTNAPFDEPVYKRFETILLAPFAGMPGIDVPNLKAPQSERIYELRSYEAATEKLHQNKVMQFNKGEIEIFDRLGFNAVFYGRVVAGSNMPNLMYMTTFENKAERDAHWKAFGDDPAWKKLNADPVYAHNFLRAVIYLLRPTAYSDI